MINQDLIVKMFYSGVSKAGIAKLLKTDNDGRKLTAQEARRIVDQILYDDYMQTVVGDRRNGISAYSSDGRKKCL